MNKALICLLLTSSVAANECSIVFGGVSKHLGERVYRTGSGTRKLNESNESLGAECNDFAVVAVKLSYYNDGVAAYYTHSFTDNIGLRLGGVYGYKDTPVNMLIAPLIQPVVKFELIDDLYIEAGAIYDGGHVVVLTANFKYKL